jgi:hypothetical protein
MLKKEANFFNRISNANNITGGYHIANTITDMNNITAALCPQGTMCRVLANDKLYIRSATEWAELVVSGDYTAGENIDITDGVISATGGSGFDPEVVSVYYVDGNRTDSYTEDGSVIKPFKTINGAIHKIIETQTHQILTLPMYFTYPSVIYVSPYVQDSLYGSSIGYDEDVYLPPFTSLVGASGSLVSLGGFGQERDIKFGYNLNVTFPPVFTSRIENIRCYGTIYPYSTQPDNILSIKKKHRRRQWHSPPSC